MYIENDTFKEREKKEKNKTKKIWNIFITYKEKNTERTEVIYKDIFNVRVNANQSKHVRYDTMQI